MSFSDLSDPPTVSDSDASDNDSQSGKDNDDQIKIVDPVEINDGLVTYYVKEPIGKRTCLFENGLSVCVCVCFSCFYVCAQTFSRQTWWTTRRRAKNTATSDHRGDIT